MTRPRCFICARRSRLTIHGWLNRWLPLYLCPRCEDWASWLFCGTAKPHS